MHAKNADAAFYTCVPKHSEIQVEKKFSATDESEVQAKEAEKP